MPVASPSASSPSSDDASQKRGPARVFGRSLGDFGNLSAAEKTLLDHVSARPPRDATGFSPGRVEGCEIDPDRPSTRPEDTKIIRASFIRYLSLGGDDHNPVHENGVWLKGAYIVGDLDLRGCECRLPLQLEKCWLEGYVLLQEANLRFLNFNGSWLCGIYGDVAKIEHGAVLCNITTAGVIRFFAAEIAGNLECQGSDLKHYDGSALILTNATIKGFVRLSGNFKAQGQVRLQNAIIGGNLDCTGGTFDGVDLEGKEDWDKAALNFQGARIAGDLLCNGARFIGAGSIAVFGGGSSIGGRSYLGCTAKGEVQLYATSFGGVLSFHDGSFNNSGGRAIDINGAGIKGDLRCSGKFIAEGEVYLWGADIGGDLDCRDATLASAGKNALVCGSARIKGDVVLSKALIKGTLSLESAVVGGNIWLGARYENPDRNNPGVNCLGAKVGGSVLFEQGLWADNGVNLAGAEIARDLSFDGGELKASDRWALDCSGATIAGNVLGQGLTANGGICFIGAQIAGSLSLSEGDLQSSAENRMALDCSAAKFGGDVYFGPKLKAIGGVKLHSGQINRHLYCSGAQFSSGRTPDGQPSAALDCDAISVRGAVFMDRELIGPPGQQTWSEPFRSNGEVRFVAATVGLQFICDGPVLENTNPHKSEQGRADWALNLGNAKIGDTLFLSVDRSNPGAPPVQAPATIRGSLSLSGLQVRILADAEFVRVDNPDHYFPRTVNGLECTADLDGFVYERLDGDSTSEFEARAHWLGRQPKAHLGKDFRHQPFDHLGKVLRAMGGEREAREIAILKQRLLTNRTPSYAWHCVIGLTVVLAAAFFDPFPLAAATATAALFLLLFTGAGRWLWRAVILDGLVAYGYRPAQALGIAAAVALALGWFYSEAEHGGAMVQVDKIDKNLKGFDFHPVIYSFDVMLPVVKLGEADLWTPMSKEFSLHTPFELAEIKIPPEVTLYVVWAEKVFGWLAGAILIAVVGGLIKKEP